MQCESPWANSPWEFCSHAHTLVGEEVEIADRASWKWLRASIPFGVISALRDLEILPDPMLKSNDLACAWTEECDWVLRTQFDAPEDYTREGDWTLHLRNLDCYAEVFLNGTKIGRCRNAFREHAFDVEDLSLDSPNELLIYFRSAKLVTAAIEAAHGPLPSGFDSARVHARRSQCLTGWDWAARLSAASLLTPPCLQKHSFFQVAGLYAWCERLDECEPGQAKLSNADIHLSVEVTPKRRSSLKIAWSIIDEATGEVVFEVEEDHVLRARPVALRQTARIENPKLWWPLAMGDQPLYQFRVEITPVEEAGQEIGISDWVSFGIRTSSIQKIKNGEAESFTPLVNGVPVFCRGANWIPVAMLQADVRDSDYEELVGAAAATGMNCLRVWGGGIYESKKFYDLCDRLGVLVWQDFMFACAAYPIYREFLDEVEAEAIYQIKRLRNHPSLLLWCGNNENEWLHQAGSLKKGNEQRIIGEVIWATILKSAVEEHDPAREYHQSSPFGRNRFDYNDETSGDRHNWDVWSGWQSPDAYLLDDGRFLSEFGFQGMPARESIDQFAPGTSSAADPILLHHQKMVQGQERLVRYMAEITGVPSDYDAWIGATQTVQAEVLRRAVEHWRRLRLHCSGTLIWQLNDAYTAVSWSLIDFYRRPKKAYFEAKRYFSPILVSIALLEDDHEVGSFGPSLWPKQAAAVHDHFHGNGDLVENTPAEKKLSARIMLINDSCLELTGQIHIRVNGGQEEIPAEDTVSLLVPANQGSPLIMRNLADYAIADFQSAYIEAEFEPDAETLAKLQVLEDAINQRFAIQAPAMDETFGKFDLTAGLKARINFVELLYQKSLVAG